MIALHRKECYEEQRQIIEEIQGSANTGTKDINRKPMKDFVSYGAVIRTKPSQCLLCEAQVLQDPAGNWTPISLASFS